MLIKRSFPLLFCLLTQMSVAQVVIDTNVIKTYHAVVQKLAPQYQRGIIELDKQPSQTLGFAIFTTYQIDTLNKKEVMATGPAVTLSNPETGKEMDISHLKEENTYLPVPCSAGLKGDTLMIAIPPIFNPYINHKIIKGAVTSTYEEYQKGDLIFRLNLSRPKTEKLSVPAKTVKLTLSTSSFKPGQLLYGEVEYETDAYYVDDSNFKTNNIHKRLRGKYVFRTVIFDINNPPH